MKIFDSRYDLVEEFTSLSFLNALILDDEVKEFTPTRIFHDEVQLFGCLYNFIKLYDVRMPD
jgi:hypothetical protein